MIGVSVLVKGPKVGVITDIEGNFKLTAPSGATVLQLTYMGYKPQNVRIEAAPLIIHMQPEEQQLDEVVVVGYGSVRKRDLTGSVASVGADKLKERSYGNALQSMAGQVSGVQITQTQGAPGMAPTIKVRGASSINAGTAPLYVIDGIPLEDNTSSTGSNGTSKNMTFNRNPLNNINPNDIESIEILKDASSAAIYGSRGANGVVLITTKQGKAGKTRVEGNYEFGITRVNRRVDVMDAKQWIEFETAARNNTWATILKKNPNAKRGNDTAIPVEFSDPEWLERIGNGTDWEDVLLRTALTHNAQISASGGSEKTQFMLSAGYLNQEGVVIENDYNRLSLRSNVNHQFNERLNASVKIALTRSNDSSYGTAGKSDAVSLALQSDPIFPLRVETGSLGFKDPQSMWNTFDKYGFQLWHPYSLTREMSKKKTTDIVLLNTAIDYKILDGLNFKTAFNANVEDSHYSSYWNDGQDYGYSMWVDATADFVTMRSTNWVWENTLNYNQTIRADHNLTGLLGYTMQVEGNEQVLQSREDLFNRIATLTGGRAAEELLCNTVTTGASNDIEQATQLARAMVTRFGMSKKYDMMGLEQVNNAYLGGNTTLNCSAETATEIDEEVLRLIKEAHQKARDLIYKHIPVMHEAASYLIDKETITGEEFMRILRKYIPENPEKVS